MTPLDGQLLEVVAENINRPRDGRLEQVITERTGLSATRAWQRVNVLLEDPEALAAHPHVLATLRSRRERLRRSDVASQVRSR